MLYKQRLAAFKESVLQEYLAECTESQRDFFDTLYPRGPADKIDTAIEQCEKTVLKNRAKTK